MDDETSALGYHRGAIFTVELGCLVSNGFDLGLRNYPIFDESYREQLNGKIIEHYWFREIGLETPALFKRFLNRKMNEIMPYYNQLYESTLRKFDPFSNYEMQTTGSSTSDRTENRNAKHNETVRTDAESTTDSSTDGTSRTLVSQTPQMQLSGHEDYATNVTDTSSNTTAKGSGTQNSTADTRFDELMDANAKSMDEYVTKVSGLTGMTGSNALMQFRETFLNVDMLVIDELQELFMGIYTDYWNGL